MSRLNSCLDPGKRCTPYLGQLVGEQICEYLFAWVNQGRANVPVGGSGEQAPCRHCMWWPLGRQIQMLSNLRVAFFIYLSVFHRC